MNHSGDANKMVDTPRMNSVAGHARGIVDAAIFAEGMKLERELNSANDRIKRLEEAGDAMAIHAQLGGIPLDHVGCVNAWREAKEAKP